MEFSSKLSCLRTIVFIERPLCHLQSPQASWRLRSQKYPMQLPIRSVTRLEDGDEVRRVSRRCQAIRLMGTSLASPDYVFECRQSPVASSRPHPSPALASLQASASPNQACRSVHTAFENGKPRFNAVALTRVKRGCSIDVRLQDSHLSTTMRTASALDGQIQE